MQLAVQENSSAVVWSRDSAGHAQEAAVSRHGKMGHWVPNAIHIRKKCNQNLHSNIDLSLSDTLEWHGMLFQFWVS